MRAKYRLLVGALTLRDWPPQTPPKLNYSEFPLILEGDIFRLALPIPNSATWLIRRKTMTLLNA